MAEKEYEELTARLDRIERWLLQGSKAVLTVDELAAYTGYTKSHIYRLTSRREIPCYKPCGGTLYFKTDEINSWLLQNRQATAGEIESKAATHIAKRRIK